MLDHHIQKKILFKLVTSPTSRFAELKPDNLDSNIFTYHLRQLISQKYVIKDTDGNYGLTSLGKAVGINIQLTDKEMLEQAHSVFFIVARNAKGEWLLRKRLAHPMFGKIGFVHGEPVASESLSKSANQALQKRTGLTAEFKSIGGGFIRIFKNEELESFTNFTVLEAINLKGKLLKVNGNGENTWVKNPDFKSLDMIPSMNDLAKAINTEKIFFADLLYKL